eukprot:386564-Rhodomonas_salina.4
MISLSDTDPTIPPAGSHHIHAWERRHRQVRGGPESCDPTALCSGLVSFEPGLQIEIAHDFQGAVKVMLELNWMAERAVEEAVTAVIAILNLPVKRDMSLTALGHSDISLNNESCLGRCRHRMHSTPTTTTISRSSRRSTATSRTSPSDPASSTPSTSSRRGFRWRLL